MRHTQLKSAVIVILGGKPHKGVIVDVLSQGAARVEFDDKSSVQASYSITGEEGTFHYPEETKTVKQSDTFGEPPADAEPPAVDTKKAAKK